MQYEMSIFVHCCRTVYVPPARSLVTVEARAHVRLIRS